MSKIILISMVKNESHILQRMIDSCKDICDAFCFVDTGSTDSTKDIIQSFLQNNKGYLFFDPFINFGKNRTNSFIFAKSLAQSYNWNLSSVYGLLLDADMILKCKSFNKNLLTDIGYSIIQKNNDLIYYNQRFIRMDFDWKCIGVTHEYWSIPDYNLKNCQFDESIIYIEDINDGGCKQDKFIRDAKLLLDGLEKEPENKIRYTFYLAQTYQNLDLIKSKQYYIERTKLGGWFEEIYISFLRLGEMSNSLEKINYYLEAINTDPTRIEAFYYLGKYYRSISKNNLANIFIHNALKLTFPTPNRSLFLEKKIFDYLLLEELSINCYYTKDFNTGFNACEKLILNCNLPFSNYDLAFNNQFFYIPSFPFSIDEKISWILFNKSENFLESSASLFYSDSHFFGIQRTVNYTIDNNGQYNYDEKVKTENFWIEFSNNLEISFSKKIDILTPVIKNSIISGIEDLRLFKYKNNFYALGTTNEYISENRNHPGQVLCHFDDHYNIIKILELQYENHQCQKNWCPFEYKDKLLCIYSYDPFIILEIDIDTGICSIYKNIIQSFRCSNFRGSTCPILINDLYYYQIIHCVYFKETRKYIHRIIQYDLNFNILSISKPFYFQYFFIEYCLGLTFDGNYFYIHYSSMDNSSHLLKIKHLDF